MRITVAIGLAIVVAGCAGGESGEPPVDPNTGKRLLELPLDDPSLGKADTVDGASGPLDPGIAPSSAVWRASRRWYQIDAQAGMAWPANSGLTWDEKYAAWIEAMEKISSQSGYGKTYLLITPWGWTVPAPTLECAENAMFLRIIFASWYELPFYMSAYSPTHGSVYYGHFGIVKRGGGRVPNTPSFTSWYKDYTPQFAGKTNQEVLDNWPNDSQLRSRYLTALKDDGNDFLGNEAYSGAYFDEVFLNKRTGYFLLYLLTHFGSMHVASDANTFNLAPEALREGDVLVERWKRTGIGHTLVVKTVTPLADGHLDVELVYGSMPRIQARWVESAHAKSYFTSNYTGGEGTNSDGESYAELGGGLKRWRTPVVKSGRWYNIVPVADRANHISSADLSALAARPGRFEQILGQMTPTEQRQTYLQEIDMARQGLRERPASCANRQRREETFEKLYKLNQEQFGVSREETDRQYRKLEDYVLAELDYTSSKTCCWNSSTSAMFEIIMDFNEKHVHDAATQTCNPPIVFKAVAGGYDLFHSHAIALGRGDEWVAWSADESCPQAADATLTDTEIAPHGWSPFCSVVDSLLGTDDPIEDDDTDQDTSDSGGTTAYVEGQPCPPGLDGIGLCDGDRRVVWCESDGEVHTYSCGDSASCGWSESQGYYWCI